jgi:hypothetical protein
LANYNTLFLDVNKWSLAVDTSGNIAVATPPYSQAQDAASAIRLWQNELYYDKSAGIPYAGILGAIPNIPLLKSYMVTQAKTVPGVVKAVCFISSISNRGISGQVQITNELGQTAAAGF